MFCTQSSSVVLLLALLSSWGIYHVFKRRSAPLPPGPRPLPFVGNALQMPRHNIAQSLASLSEEYGDVIYMHVFGIEFIILNCAEAVLELLDHRGALYSERPHSVMAMDMIEKKHAVLFHQYDENLKKHRRLLRNAVDAKRSEDYWQMQYAESHKLMAAFLTSPDDFIAHLRRSAGAFTLRLAYGYEVQGGPGEDAFVNLAEELARVTGVASEPGRWLVDAFPWLRHVPAWFPGAGFRRWADHARRVIDDFATQPYLSSKKAALQGISSFASETTEFVEAETGRPLTRDEDEFLKWTSASIYSGGTDTAVAVNSAFLLLMALYPAAQRKAQDEIETIVGKDRLAVMEDRPRLPYIEALMKEVHRFIPITPLVPHSTRVDDEFRGYRIPKGSWVIANTWAVMRDPRLFPEPEVFWPERYLAEGNRCTEDPRDYAFGYGRRRCPGVHVAESSFFIFVTHFLAVFTVSNPVDERGQKLTSPGPSTDAHISHPRPFRCTIKPRNQNSSSS